MRLRDIINDQALYLHPGDNLEKAVRILRQAKIDSIPVVDQDNCLLGVFTRSNLYDALLGGTALHEPIDIHVNDRVVSLKADMPWDELAEFAKNTPIGAFPVVDQANQLVGVLTKANMVVTLIRQADVLNAQLKAILDSIHNGVIVVDNKGDITLVNSGAERIFNIKAGQFIDLPLGNLFPDLDLQPVLTGGQVKAGLKFRYGKVTTIANITPLINDHAVMGAVAIFQDLTDLEQVARELDSVKALNRTLDTVLNIIYDGLIVVDENGTVTLSNRAFNDFLNLTASEITGKHITDVMADSRLHTVAQTGIPETGEILTIQGKPVIVSSMPITRQGKTVGAVGKATFPHMAEIQLLAEKLAFLQNKVTYYQKELEKTKTTRDVLDGMIAESPAMKRIKAEIRQIAKSTSTVLITGESGTGKELVAQAVHLCSDRRQGPFVKVNCAAIPENLLEAEMFGYAPGAFTGAAKGGKQGRFELADGGTILLDEVGDMPIALQVKILRVIQEREFERLGDPRTRKVDVRILASTNTDLRKAIEKGSFREDLYYRLNVIGLHMPPLREHPDDIKPLVSRFVQKYNRILQANISGIHPAALAILLRHSWPGNIRELENVIERAVNYARTGLIETAHFPPYLINVVPPHALLPQDKGYYRSGLMKAEREMIISAIEQAGGNKTRAAQILNLSRSRLYVKLKQYNLLK